MSDPSVSVVIPTYNRGHQVGDAVESALAQHGVEVEVIVIDDGSTDDTEVAVAARLAEWGDRVRYVRLPNGERSRARNHGLSLATKPFVAFLDSDDVWRADHLRLALAALDSTPGATAAVSDYGLVSPDLESLVDRVERLSPQRTDLLAVLCRKQLIIHPSEVVIRREVLGTDPFDPDVPGAEDWLLWVTLASVGSFVATGQRTTWMRMNLDGTFGSPANFAASLVLAGEKVIASGAPARAGVADAEVRAVCRMNAAYAHALNGHHRASWAHLRAAAAARPELRRTAGFWVAAIRAAVPAPVARVVRRRRRPPGPVVDRTTTAP